MKLCNLDNLGSKTIDYFGKMRTMKKAKELQQFQKWDNG